MKNINGKKVTIYDIARLSGFSQKRFHEVINGDVKETYQAIRKVIEGVVYSKCVCKNLTKNINILISVKSALFL